MNVSDLDTNSLFVFFCNIYNTLYGKNDVFLLL